MTSSTKDEISNLFQELIVSKVKTEIDSLKNEIVDIKGSSELCNEQVQKYLKPSYIKQIVEPCKADIADIAKKIEEVGKNSPKKSEDYLKEIGEFLRVQYNFSDEKTLCKILDKLQFDTNQLVEPVSKIDKVEVELNGLTEYLKQQYSFNETDFLCDFLENTTKETNEQIGKIIKGQDSFVKRYEKINDALKRYKESILSEVSKNTLELTKIQEQLSTIGKNVDDNGKGIKTTIDKVDCEIKLLNEIQIKVSNLEAVSSETKKQTDIIGDRVGEKSELFSLTHDISEYNKSYDEKFVSFLEKYEKAERERSKLLKVMIVGNAASIIGIVALLLLYIF